MSPTRITARDVSVVRHITGTWECSAMVAGYRVARRYMGYTKREAVAMFVREMNGK